MSFPSPEVIIRCEGLTECFQSIYNFAFAIFLALAFINFLYGAVQYLLSGAGIYVKEGAKKKMKNSIIAVVIVLLIPPILNLINPEIFSGIKIAIPQVTVVLPQVEYVATEGADIREVRGVRLSNWQSLTDEDLRFEGATGNCPRNADDFANILDLNNDPELIQKYKEVISTGRKAFESFFGIEPAVIRFYSQHSRPYVRKSTYNKLRNVILYILNNTTDLERKYDLGTVPLPLLVTSGFRTYKDQEYLWNTLGRDPKRVAQPSKDCDVPHQSGYALDIYRASSRCSSVNITSIDRFMNEVMFANGFVRYKNECWHYEDNTFPAPPGTRTNNINE